MLNTSAVRQFTWEELISLNQKQNAHVAVRGKVYDVSKFLIRHPGGSDLLLMAAGKDVTVVFETYHSFSEIAPNCDLDDLSCHCRALNQSNENTRLYRRLYELTSGMEFHEVDASLAKTVNHIKGTVSRNQKMRGETLQKYYVGDLVTNKFPTFPELGKFYKTARERVKNYFKETKQDPKNSPWMWLRHAIMPSMTMILWLAQMFWLTHSFFLSCVAAAFMGWFTALTAMVSVHDASHFAVTRNPIIWRLVGHSHDFLMGASYHVWVYQHIFGHHPYTNIDGYDPDISTAKNKPDLRRIKWNQNWLPRYFHQHIYMPLIYCLLGLKTRTQDIAALFIWKKNSTITFNLPSTSHVVIFITGKLFFLFHKILLPAMVLGVWKMIALYTIAEIVGSYWLALIFQASHVVSEVDWPLPDENGKINRDWAELQIETTQDYATDSWFFNVFTGALNHQTAHHLFPSVSQIYYPAITPIVRETCKEFGVRYNYKDTLFQALGCHISHLKRLGQLPQKPSNLRQES